MRKGAQMINILYGGNYKVFDGLLLSIMSMTKHCKEQLNIYVLTADVTELNPDYRPIEEQDAKFLDEYVKRVNPLSMVKIITLGKEFNTWISSSKNKLSSFTPFALLRLFADKVADLPDKIIYLDTDIMLNGNIKELFDYDIENYELGVVKDRYGHIFISPSYFNSGVLLMNLKKIRETKLFERVIDMCTIKKMGFPDQSALNKLCKHKLYLPRRFNEQGNTRKDTIIQHFSKRIWWFPFHTRNIKQWHIDLVHSKYKCHVYDDIYDEYLKIKEERKTK